MRLMATWVNSLFAPNRLPWFGTLVYLSLNFFSCQICAYCACFSPSNTAKHPFLRKISSAAPPRGTWFRTHYWVIEWEKKPSTWWNSNPQPQEFCFVGLCSTTVLQPLPISPWILRPRLLLTFQISVLQPSSATPALFTSRSRARLRGDVVVAVVARPHHRHPQPEGVRRRHLERLRRAQQPSSQRCWKRSSGKTLFASPSFFTVFGINSFAISRYKV